MPDFTTVEKRLLRMAAKDPDAAIKPIDPREGRDCEALKKRGYLERAYSPETYRVTSAGLGAVRKMAMS